MKQVGKIVKKYDWAVTGSYLPDEVPQSTIPVKNRAEAREMLGDFKELFGDKKAHITQRITTQIMRRVR